MLRGERVVLRAKERSDLPRWHELMNGDVQLVDLGLGPWEPLSLAQIEREFEKNLDNPRATFVIEVDGMVIGHTGLKYWSWNRQISRAELYISILDPAYLGQGYGREALELLLDWAFRIENWRKITLDTIAVNERAIRAYRAVGFVEEGRLRQHDFYNGHYVDVVMMGLLRDEWDRRSGNKDREEART